RDVLCEASDGALQIGAACADVGDENLLMILGAAGDERGDQGSAHTAAHVAHKICDACHRLVLFLCDANVGDKSDRDEEEAEADDLGDAEPSGRAKTDLKIDALCGVKHCTRKQEPATSDEVSCLNLGCELAHDWHFEKQHEPSGREREPG